MISFVFDNNVYRHILDDPDFESIKKQLQESVDRRINRFYFSHLTFIEIVKGLSERNFPILRKMIQFAHEISGGHLLLCAKDHILVSLSSADSTFESALRADLNRSIANFLAVDSYKEFVERTGKTASKLSQSHQGTVSSLKEAVEETRGLVRDSSDEEKLKQLLNDESGDAYFEDWFGAFVAQSEYGDRLKQLDISFVTHEAPGLRYMADITRMYAYNVLFRRKKPDDGDTYDMLYVYYLDRCDYIVTDDRKLRALVNDAPNDQLINRAIPSSKLFEHLKRQYLPARTRHSLII